MVYFVQCLQPRWQVYSCAWRYNETGAYQTRAVQQMKINRMLAIAAPVSADLQLGREGQGRWENSPRGGNTFDPGVGWFQRSKLAGGIQPINCLGREVISPYFVIRDM